MKCAKCGRSFFASHFLDWPQVAKDAFSRGEGCPVCNSEIAMSELASGRMEKKASTSDDKRITLGPRDGLGVPHQAADAPRAQWGKGPEWGKGPVGSAISSGIGVIMGLVMLGYGLVPIGLLILAGAVVSGVGALLKERVVGWIGTALVGIGMLWFAVLLLR